MSDASSWYQRKLAQARGIPAPPRGTGSPSIQPGRRIESTPWSAGVPAPQQTTQFAPAPKVTMENLWDSMQHWRGGKAHRIDAQPCPHCGSDKYYSRSGDGVRRGPPPAPHCFECGYNGMFEQGLATSWGES